MRSKMTRTLIALGSALVLTGPLTATAAEHGHGKDTPVAQAAMQQQAGQQPCGMMGGMMGNMMGQGGMGMMGQGGMMGNMMGQGGMGMMGQGGMMGNMMGQGGMGMMGTLDLTDEQRTQIFKIADATRKQQWELMGKMMDEQSRLRDLQLAGKPDPKQVGAVYGKIFDVKRQMIENRVAAANKMHDVLSDEQKAELEQRTRGMMGNGGMPMGGGMGMTGEQ